jgi:pimeloyl-ACP methyl ester carboxylesterase
MRDLLPILPSVVSMPVIFRRPMSTSIRARAAITTPDGVESLEPVTLGGVRQWILIRGRHRTSPLLLWLHGGPGMPTMPLAHRHDADLIRRFVVVHWDQRGAGKSYDPRLAPESITVEQLVADTHDLVQQLRRRFGAQRLYLVGHSWGAQVGALVAARYPALFYAYVGVGTLVSPEGQRIGYAALLEVARRTGNRRALRALASLGPPPWRTAAELATYGRWAAVLGGTARRYSMGRLIADVVLSPVYSLKDVINFVRGQRFSLRALAANGQIAQVDLFERAPRLDLPVYFFQGRHDLNTPGELVERYYHTLDAPCGKTLRWFEHSAHFPQWEEPGTFATEMVRVLEATYPQET